MHRIKAVSPSALFTRGAFIPALAAALFGFFLLYGTALAPVLHDAAHDSRHAFAFPCH